jgi:sterol desaturase/sphingolipid hydroxylase (fatty acid hydroxylase superfamily)
MSINTTLTKSWLAALTYPLLCLSGLFTVFCAFYWHLDFGLCNVVFLIWTIGFLSLMEVLIPYDPSFHPTKKEWLRDGIYLVITMVGGGLAVLAMYAIVRIFSPPTSSMALWQEILVGVLASSLGSYLFHRLTHVHPWLWLVHGVHHVEGKVNVGNNGVNHVLDVFGRRVLAQMPLICLGLSEPSIFVVAIFSTMQGYFVHANIDVRLGWLNYVVATPEQHRLHHSRDLGEAGNYGSDIPLWDLLFRSFTWAPGRQPAQIGVVNPEKFPDPNEIVANFLLPWQKKQPEKAQQLSVK